MCGRYVLYGPHSRYREYFGTDDWLDFPARLNVAPSQSVPVIRQTPDGLRVVNLLQWGLIHHLANDAKR